MKKTVVLTSLIFVLSSGSAPKAFGQIKPLVPLTPLESCLVTLAKISQEKVLKNKIKSVAEAVRALSQLDGKISFMVTWSSPFPFGFNDYVQIQNLAAKYKILVVKDLASQQILEIPESNTSVVANSLVFQGEPMKLAALLKSLDLPGTKIVHTENLNGRPNDVTEGFVSLHLGNSQSNRKILEQAFTENSQQIIVVNDLDTLSFVALVDISLYESYDYERNSINKSRYDFSLMAEKWAFLSRDIQSGKHFLINGGKGRSYIAMSLVEKLKLQKKIDSKNQEMGKLGNAIGQMQFVDSMSTIPVSQLILLKQEIFKPTHPMVVLRKNRQAMFFAFYPYFLKTTKLEDILSLMQNQLGDGFSLSLNQERFIVGYKNSTLRGLPYLIRSFSDLTGKDSSTVLDDAQSRDLPVMLTEMKNQGDSVKVILIPIVDKKIEVIKQEPSLIEQAAIDEEKLVDHLSLLERMIHDKTQAVEEKDLRELEFELRNPQALVLARSLLEGVITPSSIERWRLTTSKLAMTKTHLIIDRILKHFIEQVSNSPTLSIVGNEFMNLVVKGAENEADRILLKEIIVHNGVAKDLEFLSTADERVKVFRNYLLRLSRGQIEEKLLNMSRHNHIYRSKVSNADGELRFLYTRDHNGQTVVLMAFRRNDQYSTHLVNLVQRRYDSLLDEHKILRQ